MSTPRIVPLRFIEGARPSHVAARSDSSPSQADAAAVDHTESLLGHLLAGDLDVRGMADALHLPLCDLGTWMLDASHARAVDGLNRLADARTQMLLSRCRMAAATMLLRVASDDKGGEVVRKACVDLLTVNAGPERGKTRAAADTADDERADPPAQPTRQAILDALQILGEREVG